MARRRLGVALMIPDPVRREIDGLRRGLGDEALGRIAPHLALVPPVNVRDQDVARSLALVRGAAAGMHPFDLQLGPVATFHPVTPTVYLAVGGDVGAVHRLRDAVFTGPLVRPIDHAFVPHVTIAADLPIDRISGAIDTLRHYLVDVAIDRVHLLQEARLDDGSLVWEPIADAAFRAPAVVARGGLELELTVSELVPPDVSAALPVIAGYDPVAVDLWPAIGVVVTARRSDEVVGVAVGWVLGGVGHLDTVAVTDAHRREGAGSHLLAHFESACAERGCSEVVGVAPDEPAILALLARRGWARHQDQRRHPVFGKERRERLLLRRTL
jgi:2'-5' RNA ligase/GNAT superfamily N-acetyltransferase